MARMLRTGPQGSSAGIDSALRLQLDRAEAQIATLRFQLRQAQPLATLGTAAAMLAHEFNNLMTPVVAYARFAVDADDEALRVKALEMTLKQTVIITAMCDRIIGLAVQKPPEHESVSLADVLDEAVASLGRDLAKDGITLKRKVDDSIRVWADARHLQQVFFNLLLNARRAMEDRRGLICVEAQPASNGHIRIEFRDTGCGIPQAELERIFDPFVTSKDGGASGGGVTGLGLTICRELIREHGGTISASSVPGQGTAFVIELPATQP